MAPTLILSVAQRLATLTCESSRKKIPMEESIRMQFEEQFKDLPAEYRKEVDIKDEMIDTVPSPECPAGTRGRIAVFEMFAVDKEMQDVILKDPVDSAIYKVARKNGMLMMREDAMLKAIDGVIPYRTVYNFSNDSD